MVFYYLLEDMPFHHATILIHNSHLTMWQITKEELFRQALENTPRLLPATIRRMQDVVREMMKDRQMEEDLFENEGLDKFLDIRKTMRCMQIADLAERD